MDSLASLGFVVNTSQLQNASNELDNLADAGDSTEQSINGSSDGISGNFKKVGNAALIMGTTVAASVAAITVAMSGIASSFRDSSIISQMSGQSVSDIGQMAFAYKQFGLDIEQVNDIYKDSAERVGEWLNEQSGELSVFGAAMGMSKDGVTAFAKEVESLNGQQLLQRMVNDMEEAGIHGSRMSNVMESMASDATKMTPALVKGGSAMAGFEKQFKAATKGMALSGKEAESLTTLATSFDLATAVMGNAVTKLASGDPATLLTSWVNKFTSGVNNITKKLRVLGVTLATFDSAVTLENTSIKMHNELLAVQDEIDTYKEVDFSTLWEYNPTGKSKNEFFNLQATENRLKAKLKAFSDKVTAEQKKASGMWNFLDEPEFKSDNPEAPTTIVPPTEYDKQSAALGLLSTQVGKSASQLFVMAEVQKSIARNDAPALTEAIKKQATELSIARVENDKLVASQSAETAWLENIMAQTGEISKLEAEILRVQSAVEDGLLTDSAGSEWVGNLKDKINDLNTADSPFSKWSDDIDNFTNGVGTGLSAIQGLSKKGSKEYKILGVAMAANNVLAAIGAVLKQGAEGEVYTAPARMAAMAGIVASVTGLAMSISGASSGFEDESKAAQDAQGLNIWGDKSESISNSIDITASATEKLVGINTGMLNALKSVERGISGASSLVGRDVSTPQVDIGSLGMYDTAGVGEDIGMVIGTLIPVVGTYIGGAIGKLIGGMFGGKSKVVNEGIRIVGGTIGSLIEDVTLQGFQTVKYKKWRFGSSKHKTVFENIGGQAADQMSLVFGSIADSVFMGATALGMSAEEATKAINSFNVATVDISTKGLSADAKQKELEAVFSRVFDGLASSVIDFLPEMQKVGEGIGETLARVATQVQIADLMTERFGLTFGDKMANPELYARAADNITSLVGGVEELAEATSTFTKAFASDAQQLSIQQRELLRSFQAVGLELPSTSQGMWDLMQSLDGSTEQGQEQIATLLRLSGASESYIGLLDKVSKRYTNAIEAMFKSSDAVKQIGLDAALAAAKMGDMSLAEALDLGALNPNQSDFGTFADFAFAQAVTANKIQELADLSRGTVSEGQQQIDLLAKIADNTVKEPTASQTAIKVDNTELTAELMAMNKNLTETNKNQARINASLEAKITRLVAIEETRLLSEDIL